MGARQSKRSVDITTTPKKEGLPAEGGVVGDAAAPGDGKLERIEETDTKPTTNGIAPHTEAPEDKEKDKDETTEKEKEPQEEVKAEETKQESAEESPAEVAEVTTPTEGTPASPNAVASPDSKEAKKKDKKKKWSFRSISFSKKDKTKPSREETRKNGDVPVDGNMSVQEPLAEGGEETESATAAATSPADEKSAVSSPSAEEQQVTAPVAATAAPSAEAKEEVAVASPATAASPAEEKKEEPTPSAPTPVPSAEDKKEEVVEKVEAAEKKVVEVSPAGGRSVAGLIRVPVFRVQPVATPSIIERKTSEDLPSLPPSSPPPTPIDPSPLQQARQAAASATALAEALKLPAEAADEEESSSVTDVFPPSHECVPQESRVEPAPAIASSSPSSSLQSDAPSSTDPPSSTETMTFVPAKVVESPAVVPVRTEARDVAKEVEALVASSRDDEGGEIDRKVESAPAEVCKRRESETNRMEEEEEMSKRSDESLREENIQGQVEGEARVPREMDPLANVSAKEIAARDDAAVATDAVTNETLPAVECRVMSEVNSREHSMKTNVSPNTGYNEKAEIETNSDACPVIKQRGASENSETEKTEDSSVPPAEKCSNGKIEQLCERTIEPEHNYAKDAPGETKEEAVTALKQSEPVATSIVGELVIDSEEGPVSVSSDVLVEAKMAVVISEEDSVEELTTGSAEAIPDKDRIGNEPESNTALPTEETGDVSAPDDAPIVQPLSDTKTIYVEDDLPPPPLSEDTALFCSHASESPPGSFGAIDMESIAVKVDPLVLFSTTIEPVYMEPVGAEPVGAELATASFTQIEQIEEETESYPLRATPPGESCFLDNSDPIHCSSSEFPDPPTDFPSLEVGESQSSGPQTSPPSSFSEHVPPLATDLPVPLPEYTETSNFDHSQSHIPDMGASEPPAPVEYTSSFPKDPTETLLTPPTSPSSQSNSNHVAATANDCNPQTHSNDEDDRSKRESQTAMGSVCAPPTSSYDHSDVELKERLAAVCLAETECQEEALSCQLSAAVLSTAAQEHHQSAPEVEAPVENNVAHDASTTDSNDEPPKVAPPAVPIEAPASPPTAPAITEDVASVTKAIEEIDISDKAVAAAVNEAIECNTNEIIADAYHQNDIKEYE